MGGSGISLPCGTCSRSPGGCTVPSASLPCPIVVTGGSNLPEGQELVGLFAYRLVSGHCQVQTGVARIGEEGTVTTAGFFRLNVVTGWDKRRPEWVEVAWLAMRVHVGRQWNTGEGLTSLTSRGRTTPPPPLGPEAERPPPPRGHRASPPPRKPRVRPPRWSGRSGRNRRQRGAVHEWVEQQQLLQRAGACAARAISAEAANRDLEARPVPGQRGQAGRRVAVGGCHKGAGPPGR